MFEDIIHCSYSSEKKVIARLRNKDQYLVYFVMRKHLLTHTLSFPAFLLILWECHIIYTSHMQSCPDPLSLCCLPPAKTKQTKTKSQICVIYTFPGEWSNALWPAPKPPSHIPAGRHLPWRGTPASYHSSYQFSPRSYLSWYYFAGRWGGQGWGGGRVVNELFHVPTSQMCICSHTIVKVYVPTKFKYWSKWCTVNNLNI